MLEIFVIILPLFLIIVLGAILERLGIANERWSIVLNSFALKIGFPALIFSALTKSDLNLLKQLDLVVANSVFILLSFLLAFLIGEMLKFSAKNMRTLFITLAFGNVAYLGIPTLEQVMGEGILPVASLIVAVYLFWMFTLGIGLMDYWQHHKKGIIKRIILKLIKNPLLIAVVAGLLVAGLHIPIPNVLGKSITMLAGSVTPVVLIVIGLFIGRSKYHDLQEWLPPFYFSIVTLIVLPALFFYGVQLFGYQTNHFSASIIEAAMPLAITPFALAEAYKLNRGFIARSIVLSTVLSIITIPLWTSLI